jgi:DNA-binding CsgD family transcriptional regulator
MATTTNNLLFVRDEAREDDLTFESLRTDSVWLELDTFTAKLGFHCWAYTAAPICYSSSRTPVRVTTYPRNHVASCVEHNLYSSSPALSFSLRHRGPAFFEAVRKEAPPTRRLRSVLDLNRQFGVTRGIVIPLKDFYGAVGMLAISFDGNDRQLDELWCREGSFVTEKARRLNDLILRRHSRCFMRDLLPDLTERQREIIRLLSCGLNTAELAESLQVSIDTINKHTATIKRRLGTRTTAQTTALATQWGLL